MHKIFASKLILSFNFRYMRLVSHFCERTSSLISILVVKQCQTHRQTQFQHEIFTPPFIKYSCRKVAKVF